MKLLFDILQNMKNLLKATFLITTFFILGSIALVIFLICSVLDFISIQLKKIDGFLLFLGRLIVMLTEP